MGARPNLTESKDASRQLKDINFVSKIKKKKKKPSHEPQRTTSTLTDVKVQLNCFNHKSKIKYV